jgi:hypothetical protein
MWEGAEEGLGPEEEFLTVQPALGSPGILICGSSRLGSEVLGEKLHPR